MHISPIYEKSGLIVDQIEIDDNIHISNDRVHRGEKCYYKGIGCNYNGQYIEKISDFYFNIVKSDVFYMGYHSYNKNFLDKFGIFKERYQPQFDDYIGGCSSREYNLIENSMLFEKSAVKIIKVNKIKSLENHIWFKLDYTTREKYINGGHPERLIELLVYMIESDWNFIWDKDSISDINVLGQVTDIADCFKSKDLSHKLGTVYSVIYSLYKNHRIKFEELLKKLNFQYKDLRDIIGVTIKVLEIAGVDASELKNKSYNQIILENLLIGKNCGDCVLEGYGETIRKTYIENFKKSVALR